MPQLPFIKMHGAGNDYVFLDEFQQPLPADLPALAVEVADRHFGIGSDGLICLARPTAAADADVRMLMLNADGSFGSMCGNGVRCIALWMLLQHRCRNLCRVETEERIVTVVAEELDHLAQRGQLRVSMGAPQISAAARAAEERLVLSSTVKIVPSDFLLTRVSMGNPHAVIFVDDAHDELVLHAGPVIERQPAFPDRTNVEWVVVNSATELTVRVWERGSGETLACGSGACAAVVAAVLRGFCGTNTNVTVHMPGGDLVIRWTDHNEVLMTGPACVSFRGQWPLP